MRLKILNSKPHPALKVQRIGMFLGEGIMVAVCRYQQ